MFVFLLQASAATYEVCDTGCDFDSMVEAVDVAVDGDLIQVHPGTWTGTLDISAALIVQSTQGSAVTRIEPDPGASTTVRFQGQGVLQGFEVVAGTERAIQFEAPTATLRDILVRNGPGGIRLATDSANLESIVLEGLVSSEPGAGVWVQSGSVTITGLTCTDVRAPRGACIALHGVGDADLEALVVTGAVATESGGAIDADDFGTLSIAASTFEDGQGTEGGLLAVNQGTALQVSSTVWSTGSATLGGALRIQGTPTELTDSAFFGNTADQDGGAVWTDGDLTVDNSRFSLSAADLDGGAVFAEGGEVVLRGSALRSNSAATGGALRLSGATLTADNLDLRDNTADRGGALATTGPGSLRYSRVCGNTADVGGGLSVGAASQLTVENTVLVDNTALVSGGAIAVQSGDVTLAHVDVLGNDAPTGAGVWNQGAVAAKHSLFAGNDSEALWSEVAVAVDWNAWWDNQPSDTGGTLTAADLGPNHVVADPLIHWSDDGTCDGDTFVPMPGSPLIDGGDPTLTDADGSRVDIGAYGGDPDGFTDADTDGVPAVFDCDDADDSAAPGLTEDCTDGIDNNCDGVVDGCGGTPWYADADGDGYGDPGDSQTATEAPSGYVGDDTDCDDGDAGVNPAADEICDGLDQDCDDEVDEGLVFTDWYVDGDLDGVGAGEPVQACEAPEGSVSTGGDCDDSDAGIRPTADEVPDDGIDQDCSGADATTEWGAAGKPARGCGCTTGASPTLPLGWMIGVLFARRAPRGARRRMR